MRKRISKVVLLSLILLFVILSSCSQDNDILATSKIKDITRKEFNDWLESNKIKKESILENKDEQKDKLKQMALEIFAIDKAKAEGFDKSRRFMVIAERASYRILSKYYLNEIAGKATFNEPAIRVSYIFLAVNRYKPDPDDSQKKIRLEDHEVDKKYDELIVKAKGLSKDLKKVTALKNWQLNFQRTQQKRPEVILATSHMT